MQKTPTELKPFKRISPSRYTAIGKCPYKAVLSNSYSFPLLPYPPASHLGNVIHECIRLIKIGRIGTSEEFDEMWYFLLEKEEKALEDMGFAFSSPLRETVPGYSIKKLQVKALLTNRGKVKGADTDASIMTEKWLESRDSIIGGFADIIITINGYTKLSDFKSGKVLLEEGEIKEEYEDQLKLYAYLHNEVFGNYPNELSIIDLEKKEFPVVFTPEECEALARKSKEVLSMINNLIVKNERRVLAKPDMINCKNCLYRPACDFYWELQMSETDSIFKDVRGIVTAVKQFRNGNMNVMVNKYEKQLTISNLNGEYLSFLTDKIGKEVAFYNVRQSSIPERFQAFKSTKIYET